MFVMRTVNNAMMARKQSVSGVTTVVHVVNTVVIGVLTQKP